MATRSRRSSQVRRVPADVVSAKASARKPHAPRRAAAAPAASDNPSPKPREPRRGDGKSTNVKPAVPVGQIVAARRRSPGRPVGNANQRERALDAALACFAKAGVAATSLRAIAVEAGVTPAVLHYYFGDKPQLLEAVVDERLLPASAALRVQVASAGEDVAALVAAVVNGVGQLVAAHPWLPALWVREVLCEGGALREAMIGRIGPLLAQGLAQRFAAARKNGDLHADLDPRLLVVSLVGLTLFPAAGAPVWRRMLGAGDIDAPALRKHTLALLAHGIGQR